MTVSETPLRTVSPEASHKKVLAIGTTAFFVAVLIIGSAIYARLRPSLVCIDAFLHPPVNISAVWTSASQTRIEWAPSVTAMGNSVAYAVSVCDTYGPCFANKRLMGCMHRETAHPWLEFRSNVDTPYCIVLRATSLCGSDVVVSDPSVMELRTPSFAPGNFKVSANATSPTSAQIVAFLPQVKNGALEVCYITLRGAEVERTFLCSVEDDMASVTELTDLKPSTEYYLSVTFANMHNGWEMGTRKIISFTTPDVPVDVGNSEQEADGWIIIVCTVLAIFYLCSCGSEDRRRGRHRRRRQY